MKLFKTTGMEIIQLCQTQSCELKCLVVSQKRRKSVYLAICTNVICASCTIFFMQAYSL